MQKNNYIYKNISTIFTNKFLDIFLIIMLLVTGYFCSTLDIENNYFVVLVGSLTYQQFISLCFLPMIILTNILSIKLFEKNSMLIIRFENKKKYLKELIKNSIICNTFLYVVMIIIILTFFNFFFVGDLNITYIDNFKTLNFIYLIFICLKLYILDILFSIAFCLLYKLLNKTYILILSIFFTMSLYICQWFNYGLIDKIYKFPLYIGTYFLDVVEYSTFYINVISFLLMSLIVIISLFLLYKFTLKHMKVVGE